MTTSVHEAPASFVTKTPFQTQSLLLSGLRSLAATTTLLTSVGLTAIQVSCLAPAVWLARASQACAQGPLASSWAPRVQSRAQPWPLPDGEDEVAAGPEAGPRHPARRARAVTMASRGRRMERRCRNP